MADEAAFTKAVYAVTERDGARTLYQRIGSARINPDGTTTIRLDALPLSGVMEVREIARPDLPSPKPDVVG